jgi:hypothetical protein
MEMPFPASIPQHVGYTVPLLTHREVDGFAPPALPLGRLLSSRFPVSRGDTLPEGFGQGAPYLLHVSLII